MLKLFAEVDEFLLDETKFMCESCTEQLMIYSVRPNGLDTVKLILNRSSNDNLKIRIELNQQCQDLKNEIENVDDFKFFFCKYLRKHIW